MSGISSIKQTPIASLTSSIQSVEARYALKTYVDQKISDVVGNAPQLLDTLQELSAALGDNPNLVASIQTNLNAEIARATGVEQELLSSINVIGTGSLTTISTTVGQEISRATAAEQALSTGLASEISRATAAEQALSTGLASEISRATAAEQGLSTGLASEITRATAAEQSISTSLSSALSAEITRATAAEANLYSASLSTVAGLGSAGYVSSTQLISTTTALENALNALQSGVNSQNASITNITTATIEADRINTKELYVYTGVGGSGGISTIVTTQVNTTTSDIWIAGGFRYKLGDGTSVSNQSTQNIRWSADGSNWSAIQSISSFNVASNGRPFKAKYISTGLFGLAHQEGFYTSADGKNWLKRGSVPTTLTYMKDFAYADGLLIGVGASKANKTGSIVWSSNFGQTWNNNLSGGFNIPGNAFNYQNDAALVRDEVTNTWVTGGQGNWAGSVGPLQYSTDGSNWNNATYTSTMTSTTPYINDIAYNGSNLFVAVGDMGIVWSADGISWTPASGTTATASAVAYSPTLNRWVYVGSGTIRTSADGKTWAATNYARGSQVLWDIKWTKDRFLAAGQSSNIADTNALQTDTLLQSADGITWTPAITNTADAFSAAYSGGALTVTYGQQVTQTTNIVSSISTLGGSPAIRLSTDASGNFLYLNGSSITQSYALSATLASTTTALTTATTALQQELSAGLTSTATSLTTATTALQQELLTVRQELNTGLTSTATYVDQKVSSIVTNAPSILDTLGEIAQSLGNNPSAFANLTTTIQTAQTAATTLTTHGLQAYHDSLYQTLHRTRYTGPYTPSNLSTLYSGNPYEHPYVRGSVVLLAPSVSDKTTTLPNYTRRWIRAATLDVTNSTEASPTLVSQLIPTYSTIQGTYPEAIPYFDFYVDPSKLYGSSPDYGYIKYDGQPTAVQCHSGHVILVNQSTIYTTLGSNATPLEPTATWYRAPKESFAEMERRVQITNTNTIGSDLNLLIQAGSSTYEIAPGDRVDMLYTHSGWTTIGNF
jgi:hypothetical protein